MRKLVALSAALVLVFALSARPANAQSSLTPPVVVDRTALTLTLQPAGPGGAGGNSTDIALSWRINQQWDALISSVTNATGVAPSSAFRIGGRYHLPPPSPSFDVYATFYYYSPSTGSTHFELGGGITQFLAPGLKSYVAATYVLNQAPPAPGNPYIATNIGVQYDLTRQFSLVVGYEPLTTLGYVGLNFDFAVR